MKESEVEMLAVAIAKALQQARSVSDSEHFDHHVWITERIKRDKASREFWEKMRDHVAKWGIISVLSFLFYALWLGMQQWIQTVATK